jgi:hypothetical protein
MGMGGPKARQSIGFCPDRIIIKIIIIIIIIIIIMKLIISANRITWRWWRRWR